ncbi:MAG: four helix bundle protein, partial [Thermoguttaceae bacterium]
FGLRPWVLGLRSWVLVRQRALTRTNFENLRVYVLAEEMADEVWQVVRNWETLARDTVGRQLVRAADSIGANIAEGSGRGSNRDFRRFLRIARGSLCETQHWLRRAFRRKLLTREQIERLKAIVDPLAPTLNAYLTSIGRNCPEAPPPQAPSPKT